MTFSEKLNSLIALTGVNNAKIAKALNIDASLVSRWRSGTRSPVNNPELMSALVDYMAGQIHGEVRKSMLQKLMQNELAVPLDGGSTKEAILIWMTQDTPAFSALLSRVREVTQGENGTAKPDVVQGNFPGVPPTGAGGRMQALNLLLESWRSRKVTDGVLRIYCDEAANWMDFVYENCRPYFEKYPEVVAKIQRVKLVCSSHLTTEEIVHCAQFVLPFMERAAVQVYSHVGDYPSLFRNFIVLLPGVGAVQSASFHGSQPVSVFSNDPDYIQSLTGSFDLLADNSTPMFSRYESTPFDQYSKSIKEFLRYPGDTVYLGNAMPSLALPVEVLYETNRMFNGSVDDELQNKRAAQEYVAQVLDTLSKSRIQVTMPLYRPQEVESGAVTIPNLQRFEGNHTVFTCEDYLAILHHMRGLMEQYPNFRLQVVGEFAFNYSILAKEDFRLYIMTNEPQFLRYATSRPMAVHAAYSRCEAWYNSLPKEERTDERNRAKLQEHILLFENYIQGKRA